MPEASKSRAESPESIGDEKQKSSDASHPAHERGDASPNSNQKSGVGLAPATEDVGSGQPSDEIDNPSPS
jgi:hypothetical protein